MFSDISNIFFANGPFPATFFFISLFSSFPQLTHSLGQWLCGSVGRAVASNTRCLRFESSHQQKFIYFEHLFTVSCVLKRRK